LYFKNILKKIKLFTMKKIVKVFIYLFFVVITFVACKSDETLPATEKSHVDKLLAQFL